MAKKKDYTTTYIFVAIALILLYGASQGWFKSTLSIPLPNQETPVTPKNNVVYSSCSQVCSNQGYNKGYSSSDCKVGESKVTYGYTGQSPILTCCCYNEDSTTTGDCFDSDGGLVKDISGYVTQDGDTIYDTCSDDYSSVYEYGCTSGGEAYGEIINCGLGKVCADYGIGALCIEQTSGGWSPGDTIHQEGGTSSITAGTVTIKYFDLEDYGFLPGGNCHPEVYIATNWDYSDDDVCMGMIAQQGVVWKFYDSSSSVVPRWTRTDTAPVNIEAGPIYPVSWDGSTRWKFTIGTLYSIPGCNVVYDWSIKIKIAECD